MSAPSPSRSTAGRAAALLVGSALVWAPCLFYVRRYGIPFPFLDQLGLLAAVALPAWVVARLGRRWDLRRPELVAAVGYCLGSGITIAWQAADFLAANGGSKPLTQYGVDALVHAATLTVMAPADPSGYVPQPGNLLWLVVVWLVAGYVGERGKG